MSIRSYISIGAISIFLSLSASTLLADASEQNKFARSSGFAMEMAAPLTQFQARRRGMAALRKCIAQKCEVLNISGLSLRNYSVLNKLSHVTVLMASRSTFKDLQDISGMTQLKELHISSTSITSLDGLKYFPNLTLLHAEYLSKSVDLAPISQLGGLTDLALGNLASGDDAAYLQDLKRLENLKISWAGKPSDLSALRGHPSLRNLEIWGGSLPQDQSALLTLRHLETIVVEGTSLNDAVRKELDRRGVLRSDPVIIVC